MSANNFLLIEKEPDGSFTLSERDADTGHKYTNTTFDGRIASLEDAIKTANKFMEEHEVEYGLDIRL